MLVSFSLHFGYDFQPPSIADTPTYSVKPSAHDRLWGYRWRFLSVVPWLMEGKFFLIGVLLYFACPPGFPVPLQVRSLCKSGDDEGFMSAFISLFIVLAMIAYTLITFRRNRSWGVMRLLIRREMSVS